MFTSILILCYALSVIIILILCVTILLKFIRHLTEKRFAAKKALLEDSIDAFVIGTLSLDELTKKTGGSFSEKVAVLLSLDRLDFLTGAEAQRIIHFVEASRCMHAYKKELTAWNKWKRARAAVLVGRTQSINFIKDLIPLLNDRHTSVIVSASAALAGIGEPSSIIHLVSTLDRIQPAKAHLVVDCLIELCGKNPMDAFHYIVKLMTSKKEHLRHWGAVIIGELYEYEAVPTLQELIKDASPRVRSSAVQALGKIGDPASYEYISLALLDPEWQVRYHAARALGALKYPAAVPALSRAMLDRQWEVNTQAVQSLIALDKTCECFVNLLNSDFPFIRWRSAESLEIQGCIDEIINDLKNELSEEDRRKKISILRSCARNGALEPFYRNAKNPDRRIRRAMQAIIKEVNPPA